MEKFYCLSSDGLIYFLGSFENWENAEQNASEKKLDQIWLFGEQTAKSWLDTLKETI